MAIWGDTSRTPKTGTPWTKVKSWFAYGLHLIAETRYEVAVAYRETSASGSEIKPVALAATMSLALGHVRAGRPESMRSLFAADLWADTGGAPRRSAPPPRARVRSRATNRLACAPS